jgi:hypothetical protein
VVRAGALRLADGAVLEHEAAGHGSHLPVRRRPVKAAVATVPDLACRTFGLRA